MCKVRKEDICNRIFEIEGKREKEQKDERYEPTQVEEFYRNKEGGTQKRRELLTADNTGAMEKNEALSTLLLCLCHITLIIIVLLGLKCW